MNSRGLIHLLYSVAFFLSFIVKTFDCRERSSLWSHSKSGGMGMKKQISLLSISVFDFLLTGEPEARRVVLWETICGSCKLLCYTILAVGVNAS